MPVVPKRFSIPRIKHTSEGRDHYKTGRRESNGLKSLEKEPPAAIAIAVGALCKQKYFRETIGHARDNLLWKLSMPLAMPVMMIDNLSRPVPRWHRPAL